MKRSSASRALVESCFYLYSRSAQISPQKRQTWRLHALFAPVRTLQGIKSRRPARHRHLWLERENWEWALCAAGDRQRADGAPRIMSRTCAATDSQNWVSPSRLIIVVQNLLSSTYKMQPPNVYLDYSRGFTYFFLNLFVHRSAVIILKCEIMMLNLAGSIT